MKTIHAMLVTGAMATASCFQPNGGRLGEGGPQDPPERVPGDDDDASPEEGADSGDPGHHGEGDAQGPAGRRVRRMTADQFHASLIAVTGQPWPQFEQYAAAMGKADFANVTTEGRELSVTFDKFVHDAAFHSCAAAVADDVAAGSMGTILRWADISDRDDGQVRQNLQYLLLRFLSQDVGDDDPRADPWMNLLTAQPQGEPVDDEQMQQRWIAVCAGLATHPDFLTY